METVSPVAEEVDVADALAVAVAVAVADALAVAEEVDVADALAVADAVDVAVAVADALAVALAVDVAEEVAVSVAGCGFPTTRVHAVSNHVHVAPGRSSDVAPSHDSMVAYSDEHTDAKYKRGSPETEKTVSPVRDGRST